jgi:uncharacterized protein (TIRG00374 family)
MNDLQPQPLILDLRPLIPALPTPILHSVTDVLCSHADKVAQSMNALRRWLRIGLRLLGPALLVYFLLTVDLGLVLQTLVNADVGMVALALVLAVPFIFFKGLRWQQILRAWHIDLPLWHAVEIYSIGIFAGMVTPGQAGDAIKAWYVRQGGHPLSVGLASVVIDRLFDVGVTALLAATGLYFFWDILPGGKLANILVVLALLGAAFAGLLVAGSRRLRTLVLQRILPRITPAALHSHTDMLATLHLTPRQITQLTAITLAGLFWTYVRIYCLFLALDVQIGLGPFIALVAVLALLQATSPGGIGTRDAALVYVLGALLQISREQATAQALALSALLLLLNFEHVLIGFLLSLRHPLAQARQEDVRLEAEL